MHRVLANYTLPTMLNSLKPAAGAASARTAFGKTNAAATTGTNSTTTSETTGAGLGTTFLNLLATELQNQDPTAPVDSTAMVGQMISLNQLDQLISINQTLSTPPASTSTTTPTAGAAIPVPKATARGSALAPEIGTAQLSPSTAGAAQLPFDPNTMMPITSNAAAVAASINSSLNAANSGIISTERKASGGK